MSPGLSLVRARQVWLKVLGALLRLVSQLVVTSLNSYRSNLESSGHEDLEGDTILKAGSYLLEVRVPATLQTSARLGSLCPALHGCSISGG